MLGLLLIFPLFKQFKVEKKIDLKQPEAALLKLGYCNNVRCMEHFGLSQPRPQAIIILFQPPYTLEIQMSFNNF